MALIFPSNPTLNQVYSTGSLSWTWNGKSWNNGTSILATSNLVSSSVQFTNGNTNAFDTNSNITVGQITASFAKISGSIFGTASFATNALSASYAPNIYVLPNNVVSSSAQLSNGGGVAFDTNNNITVNQITASFAKITNLTVEYVTSSVMVITGSNKFGDASNDTQEFTGSVSMSGSLSVVGNVTSNNVLSLASGTVSLPSLILSTDTTSGMYRIGANNIGISISAAKVLDISSTGLSVTGALSASGGYNGTVGASTANTGAFTTLSASGAATFSQNLQLGNTYALSWGGVYGAGIPSIIGSTGATAVRIYPTGSTNGIVGEFTPTGLAVTGTLTASGKVATGGTANTRNLNVGNASSAYTELAIRSSAASTVAGGATIYFANATDEDEGWLNYDNAARTLTTRVAKTTVGTWSSTGLAVTGALSSTTASNLCSTSGTLTVGSNTATAGGIIVNTSGTVGNMAYLNFKSAGTQCALFGLTGAALGTTATDALIFAETGKSINLWPNGGTTGVIINTSGNVGIGTSSPASKLHVYGSGEQYIYNQSTTAGCFFRQYPNSGSNAFIENGTVGSTIYFRTSASTSCDTSPVAISSTGMAVTGALSATGLISAVMAANGTGVSVQSTADSAGGSQPSFVFKNTAGATKSYMYCNVGAGDVALNIAGTDRLFIASTGISVTGNLYATFNGGASDPNSLGINLKDSSDTSNAYFVGFRKSSGAVIGSITRVTTTDAVAYNTTSDGRLKENLRDFTDSGRLIDSLKPRVFDWKNSDENGKNVVGFVAQEEHAADPIFAHIGAVSVGDEDAETITKQWQRSDSALIPILVAELKALRQRVAALEAK